MSLLSPSFLIGSCAAGASPLHAFIMRTPTPLSREALSKQHEANATTAMTVSGRGSNGAYGFLQPLMRSSGGGTPLSRAMTSVGRARPGRASRSRLRRAFASRFLAHRAAYCLELAVGGRHRAF